MTAPEQTAHTGGGENGIVARKAKTMNAFDKALETVYVEACIRFRRAAIENDPTTQMKFGYLADLLTELYPRQIEEIRAAHQ